MSNDLTRAPVLAGMLPRAGLLLDSVRLTRPGNALAAAALVLAGSHLSAAGQGVNWSVAWLAAAAMWCITAHGYTSNDLADVAEDRINKPHRPLSSGRVTPRYAQRFAAALALMGVLLAVPLGPVATLAALGVIGLLNAYNRWLKSLPGLGNLVIGLLAGCALVAGAVAQLGLLPALQSGIILPAAVLAAAITAREMLKTLEDIAGDRAAQRTTLATTLGATAALQVYTVFALAAWLLMPWPVVRLGYAPAYLLCTALGVGLPLILPPVVAWARHSDLTAARVRPYLRWLKISYIAGILALFLA